MFVSAAAQLRNRPIGRSRCAAATGRDWWLAELLWARRRISRGIAPIGLCLACCSPLVFGALGVPFSRRTRAPRCSRVAVPSSSGLSVFRQIAEAKATDPKRLQSPRLRGSRCSSLDTSTLRRHSACCSPLVFGALGVPLALPFPWIHDLELQSPRLRGSRCSSGRGGVAARLAPVAVPSSSGLSVFTVRRRPIRVSIPCCSPLVFGALGVPLQLLAHDGPDDVLQSPRLRGSRCSASLLRANRSSLAVSFR